VRRVAIGQSNYLPWKGYFDLIHDVDVFVFLDDVQFTKNDWRNRNRVKTPAGTQWLTIPVGTNLHRRVCDVTLDDSRWAARHWKTLGHLYGKAPFFHRYRPLLEHVYLERRWRTLSELNQFVIRSLCRDHLNIQTTFLSSTEVSCRGRREERVIALLKALDAELYISGPRGQAYLDERRFRQEGIELQWKSYAGYPEYPQWHPPFEHAVTILDLLFHTGPEAPYYVWGWRTAEAPLASASAG
jgi:WbqC-like protein